MSDLRSKLKSKTEKDAYGYEASVRDDSFREVPPKYFKDDGLARLRKDMVSALESGDMDAYKQLVSYVEEVKGFGSEEDSEVGDFVTKVNKSDKPVELSEEEAMRLLKKSKGKK